MKLYSMFLLSQYPQEKYSLSCVILDYVIMAPDCDVTLQYMDAHLLG